MGALVDVHAPSAEPTISQFPSPTTTNELAPLLQLGIFYLLYSPSPVHLNRCKKRVSKLGKLTSSSVVDTDEDRVQVMMEPFPI